MEQVKIYLNHVRKWNYLESEIFGMFGPSGSAKSYDKTGTIRDASHGYNHMRRVAVKTLEILDQLNITDDNIYDMSIVVAWLHDVNDHKYCKYEDNSWNVDRILGNIYFSNKEKKNLAKNIIDRISYSKENRFRINKEKTDWEEVLGKDGCLVRDIVSDADKLDALGKQGLERCIEYTKYSYKLETNKEIPLELLVKNVEDHSKEKLLRLKDEFIRTVPGKKMAEDLHKEFEEELCKFITSSKSENNVI